MLDSGQPRVPVRLPLCVLGASDRLVPCGGRERDCCQRVFGPSPDGSWFNVELPIRPYSNSDEEGGLICAVVRLTGNLEAGQGIKDTLG